MAINMDRLQRRKERMNKPRGGQFHTLENGKTPIRVFPYKHTVRQRDYDIGVYDKDDPTAPQIGSISEEIDREVYVHFLEKGSAPINCTLKDDCIGCKQSREYMSSPNKADKDLAKRIGKRTQHRLNAVIDKEMKIVTVPPMVFGLILEYLMDEEYPNLLGCEGRDFMITRDSTASPAKMYAVQLRDRDRSETYAETMAEQVEDLLEVAMFDPDYKQGSQDPSRGGDFKDQKTSLIGVKVTFKAEDGEKSGVVVAQDGKLVTVKDGEGHEWEMDPSEYEVAAS